MSNRYPQFCPLARVAEILGERWTLLILRELFVGPQRFSDLRRRLAGISASVLSQRLRHLEAHGLVRRTSLPPPGRADVVELTTLGRAAEDALLELVRFGLRFLGPPQPSDHLEPSWFGIGLKAVASTSPTPARRFVVRIVDAERDVVLLVRGGRRGTHVESLADEAAAPACDASVRGEVLSLVAFAGGSISPEQARASGALQLEGDEAALADFSQLFDLTHVGSAAGAAA